MKQVSSRRFNRKLSACLFFLVSFATFMWVGGTFKTVIAADDPKPLADASSPTNAVEVPGTFKDFSAPKDAVSAKRPAEQIGDVASNEAHAALPIDAQKLSVDTIDDSELRDFHATAYCLKGRTASGIDVRPGIIAADPSVLPLGTVVHMRAGSYSGTYTVADTGGRIRGRKVDVYVPTYREAMQFGRRQVKLKVLGRGSSKNKAAKSVSATL